MFFRLMLDVLQQISMSSEEGRHVIFEINMKSGKSHTLSLSSMTETHPQKDDADEQNILGDIHGQPVKKVGAKGTYVRKGLKAVIRQSEVESYSFIQGISSSDIM